MNEWYSYMYQDLPRGSLHISRFVLLQMMVCSIEGAWSLCHEVLVTSFRRCNDLKFNWHWKFLHFVGFSWLCDGLGVVCGGGFGVRLWWLVPMLFLLHGGVAGLSGHAFLSSGYVFLARHWLIGIFSQKKQKQKQPIKLLVSSYKVTWVYIDGIGTLCDVSSWLDT